ncbi:hypothetical protein EZS27_043742 [termite gut metagenome]|uniref:Uncharacterized protein n=1 Tax=termite gut metagenome TaxID=433724 RepID=A0A5J4P8D2_9ZZZZ
MENLIVLAIIERLNHSHPDKDNCIIIKSFDIKLPTNINLPINNNLPNSIKLPTNIKLSNNINFFEQYQLYITLIAEGYELLSMEKHTIKVKKIRYNIS